ncbi:MAG TPA: DUF2007 domain-containing protein [Stenotrophomonas sp.]|jgi:hypothetical protein
MRKIFSSQRVETAEGVANLLRQAGIDVRMSNGRSYQSRRSGQFSYLDQDNAQSHPTVWVVHADDQPRARELLRDARLLDTTRRDLPNVEYTFAEPAGSAQAGRPNWGWRIRLGLLVMIGVIALFIVLRHRAKPTVPPPAPVQQAQPLPAAPVPPPSRPETKPAEQEEDPSRVRIEPAR